MWKLTKETNNMDWNTRDDFITSPFFTKNISRSDLNALLELLKLLGQINDMKKPEESNAYRHKPIDENDEKDIERFDPSKCHFKTFPITKEDIENEDDANEEQAEDEIDSNDNGSTNQPIHYSNHEMPVKREHPSVFICNRLTFLIKTKYPIIWDTSVVVQSEEDCMFIALDKAKNPMIDMKEAAKLSLYINSNPEIQKEIKEFLDGSKWSGIVCSPYRMAYNGESRFGFMFTLISE